MQRSSPLALYANAMREIKVRTAALSEFLSLPDGLASPTVRLESACLQLRQVLELVAFGSLCANKIAYSAVHANFAKHWNAELLLRDLERVNGSFYPVPQKELLYPASGIRAQLEPVRSEFLGKVEFVKAYKKCAAMLHAQNPYGSRASRHFYVKALTAWRNQLVQLLNIHTIRLSGVDGFWLVHMREADDDEVHVYEITREA